jgi:hypothetical protein
VLGLFRPRYARPPRGPDERRRRVPGAETGACRSRRRWLADIPVTTQSPWLRTRAEAAILEAKGDVDGALGKLAEVEAAIGTSLLESME